MQWGTFSKNVNVFMSGDLTGLCLYINYKDSIQTSLLSIQIDKYKINYLPRCTYHLLYSYCNFTHSQIAISTINIIKETLPDLFQNHILCAGTTIGSQGSCKGDSGGPLNFYDVETQSWVQIAIVEGSVRDCGDIDYPGIYIRLSDPLIHDFIESIAKGNKGDIARLVETFFKFDF